MGESRTPLPVANALLTTLRSDSWALLLLKRRAEGPPTPEYSQAYVDGVNDAMILVGAAMAGMWFCGMAAFPRLYTPLRMYGSAACPHYYSHNCA